MTVSRPRVSVFTVCANGRSHLAGLLPSLLRQTEAEMEILVIDNASSDGSADYVRREFPEIGVIQNTTNIGFCAASNIGFEATRGRFVLNINPDTELEPDAIKILADSLEAKPRAAMVTPKICYLQVQDRINTCGNAIHISGFGSCIGLNRPRSEYSFTVQVPAVSGCAYMARRELFEAVGGLDEDYFMYVEDTDLSLRARLAGHEIWYVADAVIYHEYGMDLTSWKFGLLERNRAATLAKNLRWSTLILLGPALLTTEILMWTYASARGMAFLRAKFEAWRWLARNRTRLRRRHAEVQSLRKVSDRELLSWMQSRIDFAEALPDNWLVAAAGGSTAVMYQALRLPARVLAR